MTHQQADHECWLLPASIFLLVDGQPLRLSCQLCVRKAGHLQIYFRFSSLLLVLSAVESEQLVFVQPAYIALIGDAPKGHMHW
jgi:hypothetical protein